MIGRVEIEGRKLLNMADNAWRIGDENNAAPPPGAIAFIVIGQAVGAEIFAADDDFLAVDEDEFGVDVTVAVSNIHGRCRQS